MVDSDPPLRLRDRDLEWREVEGEIVALDLKTSSYFATNAAGRTLWVALGRGASREDLIAELASVYGIDRQEAARDADAFLAELDERGFLVADDS